jgi:MFS transporter, Spinster family, sphingosine-1-phosphate transporter
MPTKANYKLISTELPAPEDNQNNMETNSSSESSSNSVGMPSTHSSQQLVPQDTENVPLEKKAITNSLVDRNSLNSISGTEWFTVLVLCFVNLINYMDRFTIAG